MYSNDRLINVNNFVLLFVWRIFVLVIIISVVIRILRVINGWFNWSSEDRFDVMDIDVVVDVVIIKVIIIKEIDVVHQVDFL